jgi:hypothetical protein
MQREIMSVFTTTIRRKISVDTLRTGEVTGEVSEEVYKLILILKGEMKRTDIQKALELRHEDHFRKAYLIPALQENYVEMTIPDKLKILKIGV